MKFEAGFEWNGRRFGWHQRRLFALPHENHGRKFYLRELNPIRSPKTPTTMYSICGTKFTIGRLESLCKKVDWEVNRFRNKHTPF